MAEPGEEAAQLSGRPAGSRRALFALLYAAEGAPIGLIWWALPVWMRVDGVASADIARAMSLVAWPWAVKFLWAPLVDLVRSPRFGLGGWIVVSQVAMAVTLAPLLFVDTSSQVELVIGLLVAHAVAASIQDASIDTLAILTVRDDERGAINGWMQAGLLGARGLFGGGAVLVAAQLGRGVVIGTMIALILATAAVAGRRAASAGTPPEASWDTYRDALRAMLRRRELWLGFLVASTIGAGFESLASMGGPLLIDRGASEDLAGFFFLAPAVVAMAAGALTGGRLADRIGRRLAAFACQGAAAMLVVAFGFTAWVAPPDLGPWPFVVLLALLYVSAGAATASLYAALMDLVDERVAGLQFCVFMAGINVCYVWSTRALGELLDAADVGTALMLLGAVSLAVLPTVRLLVPRGDTAGAGRYPPGDAPRNRPT